MFKQKVITAILAASVLAMLFALSSCSSMRRGAKGALNDGVNSSIAGLLGRGGSGSPGSGSDGGSSSNERPAANGPERNYSGSTQTVSWPQDSSWARYGLSGLRQPAGTSVTGAALYMGQYMVSLINGGRPALENLSAQINAMSGSQLLTEIMDSESMTVGYSVPGGTVHIFANLENGDIAIQAFQQ